MSLIQSSSHCLPPVECTISREAENTNSTITMPKQTHWVWDKVTVLAKKGKTSLVLCQYCNGRFNVGSVTRIADHLRGGLFALRSGVHSCNAVPEDIKNTLLKEYDDKAKRLRYDKSKTKESNRAVARAPPSPVKRCAEYDEENSQASWNIDDDGTLSTVKEVQPAKKRRQISKADVDKLLIRGLISVGIPLDVLQDYDFTTALAAIGKYGARYLPPTLESAYGSLMTSIAHTVDEEAKMRQNSANFTGGTLILHRWEERRGGGGGGEGDNINTHRASAIVDFVFYTPSGGVFLQRIKVVETSKDADDIIERALQCHINDIGADRVVQVITDSSVHMAQVRHWIETHYPHILCRPSITHCLRHLLADLSSATCFTPIFADTRRITRILKSDPAISRSYNLQHSGYDAPETTLPRLQTVDDLFFVQQNMDGVQSFFSDVDISGFSHQHPWRESYEQAKTSVQSSSWWESVKAILHFFHLIFKFNQYIESAIVCGGQVYAKWLELFVVADQLIGLTPAAKDEVRQVVQKYWSLSAHSIDAAAFALDPEFWDSQWSQETNSEIMRALQDVFHRLLNDTDQEAAAMSSWLTYRMKQGHFGQAVVMHSSQMMPPFKWWMSYASAYPELQSVAKKVLGQVQGGGLVHRMTSAGARGAVAYAAGGEGNRALNLRCNLQLGQSYDRIRMSCVRGELGE